MLIDGNDIICHVRGLVQEIRNSGASGYKYITVDEDEAANVIYANNTLVHLSAEQIPKGSAVCVPLAYCTHTYIDPSAEFFRKDRWLTKKYG